MPSSVSCVYVSFKKASTLDDYIFSLLFLSTDSTEDNHWNESMKLADKCPAAQGFNPVPLLNSGIIETPLV